jgi:GH24 family phage-related lysozyme (muramidase)
MTDATERTHKGPLLTAVLLVAMLAGLGTYEGTGSDASRRCKAYLDTVAKPPIWTICRGLTGPWVVKDLELTPEQCIERETAMLNAFNAKVMACIRVPISMFEHFAYLHLAWNIGARAFCGSTLVKKLNRQDYVGACAQITNWRFTGGKDCAIPANKCGGLPIRRTFERGVCEGKVPIPGLPDLVFGP